MLEGGRYFSRMKLFEKCGDMSVESLRARREKFKIPLKFFKFFEKNIYFLKIVKLF